MKRTSAAVLLLFSAHAAGQTAPAPAPTPPPPAPATAAQPQPATKPVAEVFNDRLEALTPARPVDYYLLGEEVAAEASTYADRQLAITLFVLAAELDLRRGGRPVTASAAYIALADVITSERDRRWLLYLARTLDPRRVSPEWLGRIAAPTVESPVYQIATGLGLIRSGHGVQARQMLEKPEVQAALVRLEPLLRNLGAGTLTQLNREAKLWPCPDCSGARVIKRGNPPEAKICNHCKGDPGPSLTESAFLGQLRFEALLLQGSQRSWAAQVASDGFAPLRDSDPSSLPVVFEVDVSKVLWRGGQWVVDPSAPPPPKPKPEPEPGQPVAPDPTPSSGS
jgi:hypothetical protein